MNSKMYAFFAPLDMRGDEILQFKADFLNAVVLTELIGAAVIIPINAAAAYPAPLVVTQVVFLLATMVFRHWLRSGRVDQAAMGMAIAGFAFATLVIVSLGTIRSSGTAFFLPFVLVVSVVFGMPGLIVGASATSIILLLCILAQNANLLPPPDHSATFTLWIKMSTLIAMAGWFAHFAVGRIRKALESAVTEVHERTRELAAAKDKAEVADRAKSAFLSAVSHEMRTPVHQIIGLQHLLAASPSAPTASEKHINIEWQVDPGLPAAFNGDPDHIGKVLEVLLENAVKFSVRSPVTLRVRGMGGEAGVRALRFEVEDCGIGIPADKQDTIFALFAQAEEGLTRRFGGLGLGLALAKRLVSLMAGEMGMSSIPGTGSTFWFTVPLHPAGAICS